MCRLLTKSFLMTLAAGGLIWCQAFRWGSSTLHMREVTVGHSRKNTFQSHLHVKWSCSKSFCQLSFRDSSFTVSWFLILYSVLHRQAGYIRTQGDGGLPEMALLYTHTHTESLTSINKHSGTLIRYTPCNSGSPSFISEDERIQCLAAEKQIWRCCWGERWRGDTKCGRIEK